MEGYIAEIRLFAGNFAPRNWAYCAGQLLSIAQNTALFSLLGTTYGGNGIQTFGLPDLRSRAAVGAGQGSGLSNVILGELAGTENVNLLVSNLPSHNHVLKCNQTAPTANTPANNFPAIGQVTGTPPRTTPINTVYATSADGTMNPGVISPTGNSLPIGIMQPYLGMNYIICLFGIFPSRN